MKKLFVLLAILISVFLLLVASCSSNKNSTEACIHQTSLDLDKGNYDAVLASSCADAMQIGAAWFGKAGYDIADVINRFIDANSTSTSDSDLNIYMTALVTNVTATTLTDLDNARAAYGSVADTSEAYKDAQFYISLVDAMKSLSLIKIAIPNSVTADGQLDTTCDKNSNSVPDEADATACALIAANNISTGTAFTCNNAIYTRSTPTDITLVDSLSQPVSGTYSGLAITINGTGTPSCSTNTYHRLLYKDSNGDYWVATTATDSCAGSDGVTYSCPVLGANLDFVSTINSSLDSSISSLATSITGTSDTDVQQSIQDIKAQACCGCTVTPCAPCSQTCTSADIANYLENNLQ